MREYVEYICTYVSTRAYGKSSLPQVFAKRASVHGQWFPDNVTQLCNELVNPYSPFSPSSIVTALRLLSHRPRASSIVSLTLKLLKRSH